MATTNQLKITLENSSNTDYNRTFNIDNPRDNLTRAAIAEAFAPIIQVVNDGANDYTLFRDRSDSYNLDKLGATVIVVTTRNDII